MTTSVEAAPAGVDSVILVYALLVDDPASEACANLLRSRPRWLTSAFVLVETRSVLNRVYGVDPAEAMLALEELTEQGLIVAPIDGRVALQSLALSDQLGIDLTDAALVLACEGAGATTLATDDRKLARAAIERGLSVSRPVGEDLRPSMAAYEQLRLPPRGLPRTLKHVHTWLTAKNAALADEFWSATGAGNHLP